MSARIPFMTWGEFKAAVEVQGVKDGDVIDYIDLSSTVTVVAATWSDGSPKPRTWVLE